MENDLIDDRLISPSEPPGKKWWNASGLIVLWLGLVFCIINGYIGEPSVWATFGVLAVATAGFFIKQWEIGMLLLLCGLVLGQFGLLTFFPVRFSFGFGRLSVDVLLVAIMTLLLYTNPQITRRWFRQPEAVDEEERQEILDRKSRKFQARFRQLSTTELEKMVADQTLVPAAIRAAEIVLAKRKEAHKIHDPNRLPRLRRRFPDFTGLLFELTRLADHRSPGLRTAQLHRCCAGLPGVHHHGVFALCIAGRCLVSRFGGRFVAAV